MEILKLGATLSDILFMNFIKPCLKRAIFGLPCTKLAFCLKKDTIHKYTIDFHSTIIIIITGGQQVKAILKDHFLNINPFESILSLSINRACLEAKR